MSIGKRQQGANGAWGLARRVIEDRWRLTNLAAAGLSVLGLLRVGNFCVLYMWVCVCGIVYAGDCICMEMMYV